MKYLKTISLFTLLLGIFIVNRHITFASTTCTPEIQGTENIVYEIGQDAPDYFEGITVVDSCGTNLSVDNIILMGDEDVDFELVGEYYVHYLLNTGENLIKETIYVDVKYDITSPVIYGLPEDYTFEVNTELSDSSFTGNVTYDDNKDFELTLDVDDSNVDTETLGTYEVTFRVVDDDLNEVLETRSVHIVDETPPVVEDTEATIEVHSDEPDWNYFLTITDNYDEEFVITFDSSNIDLTILGDYTLNYEVLDLSGNLTTGSLSVHVVDTTQPVIEVSDQTVIVFDELPDLRDFILVTDNYDEEITVYDIEHTIDTDIVGGYEVKITATDQTGNETVTIFNVSVVDNEAPVIEITEEALIMEYVIGESKVTFMESLLNHLTITDNYDQIISNENIIIFEDDVNYDQYGAYPIVFGVYDSSGNFGAIQSIVIVKDNIKPVIEIENEEYSFYPTNYRPDFLVGVIATDNISQDITERIMVDDSQIDYENEGEYLLTYLVWDLAGNVDVKQVKITILEDNEAPTIEGAKDIIVEYGTTMDEINFLAHVIATDLIDSDVLLNVDTDDVNLSKIGSYEIIYHALDKAGNETTVSKTITVVDNKAPIILGIKDKYIKVGSGKDPFISLKALDNYDGDITERIEIIGDYNLNKAGTYKITVKVSDSSENITINTLTLTVEKSSSGLIIGISIFAGLIIIGSLAGLYFYNKDKFENREE